MVLERIIPEFNGSRGEIKTMKIIDFNKKNKKLIVELAEEEYRNACKQQNITSVHTHWNVDEVKGMALKAADDYLKPKLNKNTLDKLNDAIFSVNKYLNNVNKLPVERNMVYLERGDFAEALEEMLSTLTQIKKEVV